jgi:KDO2-lipid IV(A) lauroyltransferase
MFTQVRRGADGDLEELKMGPRAVTGVLRALRKGRKLVLLADQNAKPEEGVFVPFFGHLACTRSAPALIAMRRGVPILPAFVYREGQSARHVVQLSPPLELESSAVEPEKALLTNVARLTRSIEDAVRRAPDHWLWLHRRWRTRPPTSDAMKGGETLYPTRRGVFRGIRRLWRKWSRRE